jgi:NADH-quinone oxidoreductase subunit M
MPLSLLLFVPAISASVLLFGRRLRSVRLLALSGTVLQLALILWLLFRFLQARSGGDQSPMLFESDWIWFAAWNIHCHLGVDGISLCMLLLTALVVLGGVLVSWEQEFRSQEFFFLLTLLSFGAYGFFLSLDLFTLFFFLEISVIPKFLLIGIWGTGKKEYSAMKLALMLMGGSALVFVGLAGLYFHTPPASRANGFEWMQIAQMAIPPHAQQLFFPLLFLGFGVFSAIFPFHTWVPDGHSSAPTAASMFLAGISMKLGGYGCLRVAVYLMPTAARQYAPLIIVLATIAILYGAFATLMQKDLKYMNAYSSVSHCGFILLGIGMLTRTALAGAVMQMVSHGLMTALFFAAIGMIYQRAHTRQTEQLGGLLQVMPFISTVFVLAGLCSLGLPGLSGFVAEMTIFMGSWQNTGWFYRVTTILSCASLVVTAVYILAAVGKAIMGPVRNKEYLAIGDAGWNERSAAILLLGAIFVLGVAPFWMNALTLPGTQAIMQHLQESWNSK